MKLRNKIKRLIIHNLSALAQVSNFTIFLGLAIFPENIYNSNLSFKATKIKQKNMKVTTKRTKKNNTKNHKKQVYKERKMILIAFENYIFPLRKQYSSGVDDWEEDETDSS